MNIEDFACELFEQRLSQEVIFEKTIKRHPIHVVYGGANLFRANTPKKLGEIALQYVKTYAPNFAHFAKAMWMPGAENLPVDEDSIKTIEDRLIKNSSDVKKENFPAWLAWTVYQRTIEKLKKEPVEDFRIDFEDGYGFRADEEEDKDAILASAELAKSINSKQISPFCGFRTKSFSRETFKRAIRTLKIFLLNLIEKTQGKIPEDFVVTLPKICKPEEVEILAILLEKIEEETHLEKGKVKIEIMVETPQAILDKDGRINLHRIVRAGNRRVVAAHFGAFDYTASFGISGIHQHLKHDACNLARQIMQIALSPLGIRLSDSVTIEMPIPPHKGENLSLAQILENKAVVHQAWQKHFNNITFSLSNGFYQSWDLHPAQLVARYASVYTFFLLSFEEQAKRLKNFIQKATQASVTGNIFDDAASANGILNFFRQGLACGALKESEVFESTGLNEKEIYTNSFLEIVKKKK